MDIHIIKMPDIGEGIAEVELVQWHVKPGDSVAEDQLLAEVMTDKATVEIPSPMVGTVRSLGGKVGDILAVGSNLISLEVGDRGAAFQATMAALAAGKPAALKSGKPSNAAGLNTSAASARASVSRSEPLSEAVGRSSPLVLSSQALDTPVRADASPAVRARAKNLGIALSLVRGSGPGGRVTHADLDAYLVRALSAPAAPTGAARYSGRDDQESVPVRGLRRKIAQKMQESKRRIPHFTYVEEIDVTGLESLRADLNEKWGADRGHLTLLPLLVRALVLALREFPDVNACFDDEGGVLTRYGAVHAGIATQTESGLIVPVVRHAEALDLWACATEIARIAQRARSGKSRSDELSGSTITITSLGALGGIVSTPIINYPEVAIVGINRIVQRPVVLDGVVVVRKMMNLSSSFDHRVIDGVVAARFVQSLRAHLECPATLFIE